LAIQTIKKNSEDETQNNTIRESYVVDVLDVDILPTGAANCVNLTLNDYTLFTRISNSLLSLNVLQRFGFEP